MEYRISDKVRETEGCNFIGSQNLLKSVDTSVSIQFYIEIACESIQCLIIVIRGDPVTPHILSI